MLRADGYSPASGGSYPVLLPRTPCDKASESNAATARDLAARGYVVAVQDIRARYASDGDFVRQFQDSAETFDAQTDREIGNTGGVGVVVGQPGLEPGPSVLSGLRSNRLSYWPLRRSYVVGTAKAG